MPENALKNRAIALRREGLSYSEIQKHLSVPKSSLSYWFRTVRLTAPQRERLLVRRKDALRSGAEKKKTRTRKLIDEIRNSSAKDIKEISRRALWLRGIMLYWRERFLRKGETDVHRGVRFTSSDPELIKFFLKWLFEVGGLEQREIIFDIFLSSAKRNFLDTVIHHWSRVTGYPITDFHHVYIQKRKTGKNKRRYIHSAPYGLLRIRVRASSMLARQITGWVRGIERQLGSA